MSSAGKQGNESKVWLERNNHEQEEQGRQVSKLVVAKGRRR
jgi:hypothetical protein